MAGTVQHPRARAGVEFTLDSLKVEDGCLVVNGQWHGVRGLRFVRPTLVAGGREILSTLDHKPWAPDTDPWAASFPWGEADVPVYQLWLSVAPSVTVQLTPESAPAQRRTRSKGKPVAKHEDALRELRIERDSMREQLQEAVRDRDAALRTRARMEAQRDEAFAERNAAERERDRALAERDSAAERRDAAIRDHEVATREHRKMQAKRDEAIAAQAIAEAARDIALTTPPPAEDGALLAAERARDAALAERDRVAAERDQVVTERDEAVAERDEARAQRDDALLAQRALEQRRDTERPPVQATDAPIGVRTVSIAGPFDHGLEPESAVGGLGMKAVDRVAIRIFASVAVVCAFLLFVTLLGLFF